MRMYTVIPTSLIKATRSFILIYLVYTTSLALFTLVCWIRQGQDSGLCPAITSSDNGGRHSIDSLTEGSGLLIPLTNIRRTSWFTGEGGRRVGVFAGALLTMAEVNTHVGGWGEVGGHCTGERQMT